MKFRGWLDIKGTCQALHGGHGAIAPHVPTSGGMMGLFRDMSGSSKAYGVCGARVGGLVQFRG